MYLVKLVNFVLTSQVDMTVLENGEYIPLNEFVAGKDCVLLQVVKTKLGGTSRQVGIFLLKPHNKPIEGNNVPNEA